MIGLGCLPGVPLHPPPPPPPPPPPFYFDDDGGGGCPFARYLQLSERNVSLWKRSPNEFIVEEELEEEGWEAEEGVGGGVSSESVSAARSAGLSLIRSLCEAFPKKVSRGYVERKPRAGRGGRTLQDPPLPIPFLLSSSPRHPPPPSASPELVGETGGIPAPP